MDKEPTSEELYLQFYPELRRLANQYLQSERSDHTLQPTALVHELWFKISKQKKFGFENPQHFFALSARMMRQILVDHARKKRAGKRNKDFDEDDLLIVTSDDGSFSLLELENSLGELAKLSERAVQIVEMKFFAGLNYDEIGQALNISVPTVKRDWQLAKGFLKKELGMN